MFFPKVGNSPSESGEFLLTKHSVNSNIVVNRTYYAALDRGKDMLDNLSVCTKLQNQMGVNI